MKIANLNYFVTATLRRIVKIESWENSRPHIKYIYNNVIKNKRAPSFTGYRNTWQKKNESIFDPLLLSQHSINKVVRATIQWNWGGCKNHDFEHKISEWWVITQHDWQHYNTCHIPFETNRTSINYYIILLIGFIRLPISFGFTITLKIIRVLILKCHRDVTTTPIDCSLYKSWYFVILLFSLNNTTLF